MKKTSFLIFILCISLIKLYGQGEYQLVWSDEFDNKQSLPDNWNYDTGGHGWGNNELQIYTRSTENSFVENGVLTIMAKKVNDQWTSARLVTKNKHDFLYGRFEISAKLPGGVGTWPAIWMLPSDWVYGGWPECGEIDIIEHVGYTPGIMHGTVHTGAYNHVKGTQVGKSFSVEDFSEKFHNYVIEWDETKIDFFIDDQKYFTFFNDQKEDFMTWPFDQKFHLILNIAIGGNWGGKKGIDPTLESAIMEVDYVRVFQKK